MSSALSLDPAELLERDPRIAAARLLPDRGGDSRQGPAVLVLPQADWLVEQRASAAASVKRSLRSWEATYDVAYRQPADSPEGPNTPSFAGWISSFDRKPIALEDMRGWLHDVTELLLSLPHGRVQEIGCGTGLLVQAVGPHCSSYEASDLSGVVISRLRAWLSLRPDLAHVSATQRGAHDTPADAGEVDLVVINSVAQYFPSLSYLSAVLEAAWSRLAPGGHIVVGDVRLAALLPGFIAAVELAKAPDGMDVAGLRRAIHAAWLSHSELAIDPAFFHRFAREKGGTASTRLKPGRSRCEMTRYRSDAVLAKPDGRVAGQAVSPAELIGPAELTGMAALQLWLGQRRDDPPHRAAAVLRNIGNPRILGDVLLREALAVAPAEACLAELRALSSHKACDVSDAPHGPLADPADIMALCDAHGVACILEAAPGSPEGRFDAWIGGLAVPQPVEPASSDRPTPCSEPLLMLGLRRLVASLHTSLAADLPPEQMPEQILPVLRRAELEAWDCESLSQRFTL